MGYSLKTLEDITRQEVKYFRVPGFSITENEKWAFEVLVKNGKHDVEWVFLHIFSVFNDFSTIISIFFIQLDNTTSDGQIRFLS